MAERFKYKAYNQKGRPIRGVITAANEVDLYNQLQAAGLDLVSCTPVTHKSSAGISLPFLRRKAKTRDLIQLFISFEQMQGAGVPMLEALADIRESMDNPILRDVMSDIYKDVMEGSSLSDAMANHPSVFGNLYLALIRSGEATGDLTKSYGQLVKSLKWKDDIESKIKKAKTYPMILGCAVLLTVGVMMGFVVPQIVGFLKNLGQELPFLTTSLIATSDFVRNYWWVIGGLIGGGIFLVKFLRKMSSEFKYRTDALILELPIAGNLIRKINIARYAQTFGALYSSGIPVINCLKSSQLTVSNLALIEALEATLGQVQTGSSLSQAFAASGEFPNLVVRMIKIGEESGNLTPVFDQVSEFYTKDVDEAVQGLITMIEPALTAILGGMILWIAGGVFGPIYSSFEKMDF